MLSVPSSLTPNILPAESCQATLPNSAQVSKNSHKVNNLTLLTSERQTTYLHWAPVHRVVQFCSQGQERSARSTKHDISSILRVFSLRAEWKQKQKYHMPSRHHYPHLLLRMIRESHVSAAHTWSVELFPEEFLMSVFQTYFMKHDFVE